MPVRRGPDGKIIEVKSKPTPSPNVERDKNTMPQPDGANKPPVPPGGGQAPGGGRLEEPTKKMQQGPTAPGGSGRPTDSGRPDDEEHTRINTGDRTGPKDPQPAEARTEKADSMHDPVVGWLVILEGPGKGRAMQLGYGSNPIGRGETDRLEPDSGRPKPVRVNLNFGDDQISRGEHAIVTYDPRGRKFYVQHGGGTNLTYLNDDPVLIPIELPALSHINIGNTVLRFVPLCGDAFDWQDTEE